MEVGPCLEIQLMVLNGREKAPVLPEEIDKARKYQESIPGDWFG